MIGLAKIAAVADPGYVFSDQYEQDPHWRELVDAFQNKWDNHRRIERRVNLKEKVNDRKFTTIGGLAGSTTGALLTKNNPQAKILGTTLGGLVGGGVGFGLADLSFEHFNKDLVGDEAVARQKRDHAQHRLFRYLDEQGYQPEE